MFEGMSEWASAVSLTLQSSVVIWQFVVHGVGNGGGAVYNNSVGVEQCISEIICSRL